LKINLNIKKLNDKNCYIYPYSSITKLLKKYLQKADIKIKGFLDSNVVGKDIYKLDQIDQEDIGYIFIYSRHYSDIYRQIIKTVDKKKIYLVSKDLQKEYIFTKDMDSFLKKDEQQKTELIEYIKKQKTNYNPKDEILLIGIDFIDLNIKYLYLYLKKYSKYKIHLATNNTRDIKLFKTYGIDVIYYDSKEFIEICFRCKVKIVDHTPTDDILIDVLKVGKSIQLWHGVTIELLGVLADYKVLEYDLLLSTSQFVTDYSFSKLYDYKKVTNCGYPRNDVLIYDDIELLNVDLELLDNMKNDNFKYIVYMPTYRPNSFSSNSIDYSVLDNFGRKNGIKFIIKMHPFIAEQISEDLLSYQDIKDYTNLYIPQPYQDIYPLLKYSDMLIADYSSVYFDYLFLDKPIVFFPYDYEEWAKSCGGTMIDYFSYSPGDKYYTFDKLLDGVLKNLNKDDYKTQRKEVFDKMFENQTQKASALMVKEIEKLL